MKLDRNCINSIMLYLEENINIVESDAKAQSDSPYRLHAVMLQQITDALSGQYKKEDIWYTIDFIRKIGFVEFNNTKVQTLKYSQLAILDITPAGHEYLRKLSLENPT